jgi:hypothetical protein
MKTFPLMRPEDRTTDKPDNHQTARVQKIMKQNTEYKQTSGDT